MSEHQHPFKDTPHLNSLPHASQVRSRPPVVTVSSIRRIRVTTVQLASPDFRRVRRVFRLRFLNSQSRYAALVGIKDFDFQSSHIEPLASRWNFSTLVDYQAGDCRALI